MKPKCDKNWKWNYHSSETAAYAKTLKNWLVFNDFEGSGVWLFDRNVIQNRSKNEVETRLACVIDFGLIFGRFWDHFGEENRSKIDSKTMLKSNAKQEANRTAKEAPKGRRYHGQVRVSVRRWGRGGNLRRGEQNWEQRQPDNRTENRDSQTTELRTETARQQTRDNK